MFHEIRWTPKKIARRLSLIEPLVYRQRQPLAPFRWMRLDGPRDHPPVETDADDSRWELLLPGAYWGERLLNFVMRASFRFPQDWDPALPAALFLPLGEAGDFSHPEALAYLDGKPYASCDRHHQEILLPAEVKTGQAHLLALHGWTGLLRNDPQARLLMRECSLVQIDQPTRDFVALARVMLGSADLLNPDDPARGHLYHTLDQAFQLLDTREPFGEAFYASVSPAYERLVRGLIQSGVSLPVNITAAGHAHIDVAWLWTVDQTRRKAGCTFHNVVRLMENYPEFYFSQSQPQLYEFVRQDYPALFEQIRRRVAEGRWEPLGGMWVEADCNLTGAESLARQFLLGRGFFRQHFGAGAESPVLWLPDVFGYAWNLPQLIRQAGMNYFFTIKIGWNQYNRMPYDTFWWQGLDGTRVLTHYSPTTEENGTYASTYNADATPRAVMSTWHNFQQKDAGRQYSTPPLLMAYGYGDGGGGPTREMIENLRPMARFPSMPRVAFGKVGEFFSRLESEMGASLPVWNGELYLEYHRGTYTTQSRNKRANRKAEFLLHDAEFLAAAAARLEQGWAYPQEALKKAWETVCLNQFHDILPGSSIGEVYRQSLEEYQEVMRTGEDVCRQALHELGGSLGGDAWVANPTSFARHDLAFIPGETGEESGWGLAGGEAAPVQPVEGGLLVDVGQVEPYSITPLVKTGSRAGLSASRLCAGVDFLENEALRVEFNPAGDIVRIFDRLNRREVLPAGQVANQLQAFEDRPVNWDAWDVDIFYDDKLWLADPAETVKVIENGPLRVAVEIRRNILHSPLVQRISLQRGRPQIDFDTRVDWRERHILLKTAFPVEVFSPQASYEIQWGSVQRPTHRNTSWDWARFETCAQKWVDLSEGDYGVSLLNDCKYGHDIRDNVMRLSLLRSTSNPDPQADLGLQQFAYSLLVHQGGWDERTISAAYALNDPLRVALNPAPGALSSIDRAGGAWLRTDAANVVIETVKQAEDGAGVIVRLYESQRRRGQFTLTCAFPVKHAWLCNLLEEKEQPLEVSGNCVHASIRPFQIMTICLENEEKN